MTTKQLRRAAFRRALDSLPERVTHPVHYSINRRANVQPTFEPCNLYPTVTAFLAWMDRKAKPAFAAHNAWLDSVGLCYAAVYARECLH